MKIVLSKKFEEMIFEKYHEMKSSNITEDFINNSILGKIKIFINSKPEYCLLSFKFSTSYLEGDDVYIGSNKKATD